VGDWQDFLSEVVSAQEVVHLQLEFTPQANPPSHKASAGHLAIPPCSKLQGILAKANEQAMG